MAAKTLTTKDVVKLTGFSRALIYQFIKSGQLAAYRPAKRKMIFLEDDITNFIENCRVNPQNVSCNG